MAPNDKVAKQVRRSRRSAKTLTFFLVNETFLRLRLATISRP